jgi:predicted homoserine dehydrogenase-like protein
VNLYRLLHARIDKPIPVGLIGAGKFASMFLAQARATPGIHIAGVCDLDVNRARAALLRTHKWVPPRSRKR